MSFLEWVQANQISRLTLTEAINQTLVRYNVVEYNGIPRLGISPYIYGVECERGEVDKNTTAFPHSIGLAATFSREVLFNMSDAVSKEVRGRWNSYMNRKDYSIKTGLSCYSPVINLVRHPLWGRNMETYGECPYLTGQLAQQYVKGLQGNHTRYIRAVAGCKHLNVHGGPENIPSLRFNFDSKVTTRDWRMTFLPAFKQCVEAGSYSLMCSYNSINGVPACANHKMMHDIVRGEWGFKGYVVGDAGAVDFILSDHHYTTTALDTAVVALRAGVSLELLLFKVTGIFDLLGDAVKQGLLYDKEVRDAVKPLLYSRMRLGHFDPSEMNPYSKLDMSEIQCEDHRQRALRAAQMSFVLLKNDKNLLPLKTNVDQLAIVGPFANETDQLFGDYSSAVTPQFTTTVWQGLKKLAKQKTNLAQGCDDTLCKNYDRLSVEQAVQGSNLVVVALGTGQVIESEGHDRADIALPGHQLGLLQDAVYYSKGAPVIVLLFNAGPLDVTWAKLHPGVTAMLACFFPAQSTGMALYNTLTAASADALPAGRLPSTWPAYMQQVKPITDYTMDGRTYRYYEEVPLYPFGYGLSYTTFIYSMLQLSSSKVTKGQDLNVNVTVENTGSYDSDEVVQVYLSWPSQQAIPLPKLQLVGFERIRINRGQMKVITFTVTSEQMSVWLDDDKGWDIIPGTMTVYVGGQQPNTRTRAPSNVVTTQFMLTL